MPTDTALNFIDTHLQKKAPSLYKPQITLVNVVKTYERAVRDNLKK